MKTVKAGEILMLFDLVVVEEGVAKRAPISAPREAIYQVIDGYVGVGGPVTVVNDKDTLEVQE